MIYVIISVTLRISAEQSSFAHFLRARARPAGFFFRSAVWVVHRCPSFFLQGRDKSLRLSFINHRRRSRHPSDNMANAVRKICAKIGHGHQRYCLLGTNVSKTFDTGVVLEQHHLPVAQVNENDTFFNLNLLPRRCDDLNHG